MLMCWGCDEVQTSVTGWSEAADVGEALELLREVVFIENWVCTVLHHLQRHCAKNWCKLVDALRSREENKMHLPQKQVTTMCLFNNIFYFNTFNFQSFLDKYFSSVLFLHVRICLLACSGYKQSLIAVFHWYMTVPECKEAGPRNKKQTTSYTYILIIYRNSAPKPKSNMGALLQSWKNKRFPVAVCTQSCTHTHTNKTKKIRLCSSKKKMLYLSTMCVWSRESPSMAVHSGHLNFFLGVT